MAAAIAELPVAALRLPVETVDALRRLGVERIGQLAAMPSAPLTRRFGPDVRRRLDQALGHAAEPFDALMPPEIIRRRLAFAEPIASREALSDPLCGSVTISAVTSLQKRSGFAGSTSCSDVSTGRPKPFR